MESQKLSLDLTLLAWIAVVLGKVGWSVAERRVLWGMTAGCFLTNGVF